MTMTYTHISDLAKEAQPPDKGILSRTLFNDEKVKTVIFGFAQGEELSEHTASMPAILHFLQGEATVTLGDDTLEAKAGTWVHMPTRRRRMPHPEHLEAMMVEDMTAAGLDPAIIHGADAAQELLFFE